MVFWSEGRALNVGSAVLENFKSLVRQYEMRDEDIIIKQSKGTNADVCTAEKKNI